MARIKIDYGIDLGTTNSAICRMEKGVPVIQKIEVTDNTMPSCVFFNRRGGLVVGASAYRSMKSDKKSATKTWKLENSNTYVEFKRTMGTDKIYHSKNMETKGLKADYTSEELSAEVLKALKSFVADETIHAVVVTVPAKFTINQKTATLQAAKLAGFDQCELLQEPIAASMAYGLSTGMKDAYWMVFDFGGGTFDAALLKVEDGIMQVFDTEGDNYLGGKNLDYAIVDSIIIPYLKQNYEVDGILACEERKEVLRDAMKTYAEEVKNKLSFQDKVDIISNLGDLGEDDEGNEIELDMTISREQAFYAMRPYFQKAVDICRTLLERNNINGDKLDRIIMVGGPTNSPLIRQMLKEQVSPNVDTSMDPMTVVATGAALYASTIEAQNSSQEIGTDKVALDVSYESTTVETTEWVSISLNREASGNHCPDEVYIQMVRSDNTWSGEKARVDGNGNVFEVSLKEGQANSFSLLAYDAQGNSVACFPDEITIIQGTKVGAAPLPYYIGIEVWYQKKEKLVFVPIQGLEKNKPLPATGILNALQTSCQLRPGNADDKLIIPIYQADEYDKETSSKLYEHVTDVIIDGSEIDRLIPERTLVDLTIKADTSEMMTIEAYFPATDTTVEKTLSTDRKQSLSDATKTIHEMMAEAKRAISHLVDGGVESYDLRLKLEDVKTEQANSSETKMVLQHLKEVMREIEKRDAMTAFDREATLMKIELAKAEQTQKQHGTPNSEAELSILRAQANDVLTTKNVDMAIGVRKDLRSFDYELRKEEYIKGWLLGTYMRFESIEWKDKNRAKELVHKAFSIMNDNRPLSDYYPYVSELISLMPPLLVPETAHGRLTN